MDSDNVLDPDTDTIVRLYYEGQSNAEIGRAVGRSKTWAQGAIKKLLDAGEITERDNAPLPGPKPKSKTELRKEADKATAEAALHTPIDTQPLEKIRTLESELARLRQQLTWAQRADSTARTGGLLTLRASDHHYGDSNHLLSCGQAMWQKVATVVQQYEPDEIQILAGDDWIAGRGIYKNQDLDMSTPDEKAQITVGCMKARAGLQAIREVSDAPIVWRVMRGNHDYANNVSMTEDLFFRSQNLNKDIPNLQWQMNFDSMTVNLACDGTHNVLVRHGFGYSKNSPNSPAFIDAIKDEIIVKQRKMMPHENYRRVLSGHTHWFSIGVERQVGLFWDTTGGLQRNTRIRIGTNQRPVGWIIYVSPPGLENEILAPIGVQPDQETYEREIADPHLNLQNQKDAAESVEKYNDIMRERGDYGEPSNFGVVNEGRW